MAISRVQEGELRIQKQNEVQNWSREAEAQRRELYRRSGFDSKQRAGRLVNIDGMLSQGNDAANPQATVPKLSDDAVASVHVPGSGRVSAPPVERGHRELIESVYQAIPEQHRALFLETSLQVGQHTMEELERNPSGLAEAKFSDEFEQQLLAAEQRALAPITHDDVHPNREALEGMRLRISMMMYGAERYLRDHIEGMGETIELDQDTRAAIAELKEMLADWPEGHTERFSYSEVVEGDNGERQVVERSNVQLTRQQAEELLQKLQQQLEVTGGMTTMARLEMQKRVQEHRRAMDALSNILKNMHDTQKTMINNVR